MTIFISPSRSSGSGIDLRKKVITRDEYQKVGSEMDDCHFTMALRESTPFSTSPSAIVHYFHRYRNKSCAHRVNKNAPQSFCRDHINTIQHLQ